MYYPATKELDLMSQGYWYLNRFTKPNLQTSGLRRGFCEFYQTPIHIIKYLNTFLLVYIHVGVIKMKIWF